MRTFIGIHPHPSLGDVSCLTQALKGVCFVSVRPVKPFIISVLCWLSFLNEYKFDLIVFASVLQSLGDEFRSVVQTESALVFFARLIRSSN